MFKLFKKFRKREWFYILFSLIFIVGQVWLDLKMPDYMAEITVLVQTEGSLMKDILINGGYMLLCALGSLVLALCVGYIIANLSASFSFNIRKRVFNKVEDLSLNEVKNFSTSSLITRTTNDITQVEMFIGIGLQMLIKAPITAVWAVTKILNKNLEWSIVTGIAVAILLTMVAILTIIVVPKFKIVQKLIDKINGVTRENLNGIRVIRAFNAEDYQENKFSNVNNNLTDTLLFNQKSFAFLQPIMFLVLYFLTLAIYFVGAILIKDALMVDKLSLFGDMVVFSSYAMQVIISFLLLAVIFMMLPRAQVSAKRINEVMECPLSILDGDFDGNSEITGVVEFKNVSFKYQDAEDYLLKDITFKVNKGETIAFIGATGSGKSTLINLVPRFYDVSSGEVLVDGVNVKEYNQEKLRNKLGYVSQKAILFKGSVKSNILYGRNGKKDIDDISLKEVIKVAQAEDFVLGMDKGMDSEIAQGGTNISGGQKQRLSIARAIARNPEIYIFDDSFSALDYKTDANLRKELKKYTKDATVMIVAQRIGTIMHADKIMVLDNGVCVGYGTHEELLKNCDIYRQIALSQITEEELENEG